MLFCKSHFVSKYLFFFKLLKPWVFSSKQEIILCQENRNLNPQRFKLGSKLLLPQRPTPDRRVTCCLFAPAPCLGGVGRDPQSSQIKPAETWRKPQHWAISGSKCSVHSQACAPQSPRRPAACRRERRWARSSVLLH